MIRRLMPTALFVLLLSACAAIPAATVTVTAPAPAPSTSASVGSPTPSVSPAAPSPTPSAPTLNVSAWDRADFASPSGRIWCALSKTVALCHFPFGFTGSIPSSAEVCPEDDLDVTGVRVSAKGAEYFCSGDPSSLPEKGADSVNWRNGTGFPWVHYDGRDLATLPYGRALRHSGFTCLSEKSGMTCTHGATQHGFSVAKAGAKLF
jgi:hypothetical protein